MARLYPSSEVRTALRSGLWALIERHRPRLLKLDRQLKERGAMDLTLRSNVSAFREVERKCLDAFEQMDSEVLAAAETVLRRFDWPQDRIDKALVPLREQLRASTAELRASIEAQRERAGEFLH